MSFSTAAALTAVERSAEPASENCGFEDDALLIDESVAGASDCAKAAVSRGKRIVPAAITSPRPPNTARMGIKATGDRFRARRFLFDRLGLERFGSLAESRAFERRSDRCFRLLSAGRTPLFGTGTVRTEAQSGQRTRFPAIAIRSLSVRPHAQLNEMLMP